MKVFILLSVFALAFAGDRECGENSHYESCGTACPLTCENYDNPPKACVLMCNPGCHCDEGYVKTKEGRCIRSFECPQKAFQCGENLHYEPCGTSCPLTCENYANPPLLCNKKCNPGCHCDEGYVRTKEGRCIKSFQCPQNASQVCGKNEYYSGCSTACPLTCDNYDNPPKVCVAMCKIGCVCEKGFVRSSDGRCVTREECPPRAVSDVCGENERYSSCGTACPLTCDNFNNPPKICPLMCKIGCECEKGFVRSSDGRCVRPDECPSRSDVCGENERYSSCGTACPLTCDNYNNPPKICPLMCKIGCECEKGFVKSNDGRCVRPEQCYSGTDSAEACDMPAETGVCRGFFPRFYFDRTTGQCQKFVYGGCGGNENNFETIEGCQQKCGTQSAPEVCSQEAEVGRCRGYFPRYYYDKNRGRCQKFIYGGCGGNENNFETLEDCHKTCA